MAANLDNGPEFGRPLNGTGVRIMSRSARVTFGKSHRKVLELGTREACMRAESSVTLSKKLLD